MTPIPKNTFYDINKLPKGWGLIVFPISMSRISNAQSAAACIEQIRIFTGDSKGDFADSKLSAPKMGWNIVYGDFLYLYSDQTGASLRQSFLPNMILHKNRLRKHLNKNKYEFQIQHGINFHSWVDLCLNVEHDFFAQLQLLRKDYDTDPLFQ